jgi:hypothetical protein
MGSPRSLRANCPDLLAEPLDGGVQVVRVTLLSM